MTNGSVTAQQAPQGTFASAPPQQQGPMLLPGVVMRTSATNVAPMLLVEAYEKAGKSATVTTTLSGYPTAGKEPLVIAFDSSGPDSCIRLGYTPRVLDVKNWPQGGKRISEKARSLLGMLATNRAQLHDQHGSIVVDCCSTMSNLLLDEARSYSDNPDGRSHYRDMMTWGVEIITRVSELGLPHVWLAWLSEPEITEDRDAKGNKRRKVTQQGGVDMPGKKFRKFVAGKADHIFILERQQSAVGMPGASADGFIRNFHTAPWDNINAGGRYSHLLTEPAPPHMGAILYAISSGKHLSEIMGAPR